VFSTFREGEWYERQYRAQVIDLGRRRAIPELFDSHTHPSASSESFEPYFHD
jgi:Predicted metal-dependent hydrolase with the TIM-barrel fold